MHSERRPPIDIQTLKQAVDLVEYAARYTALVQVSRLGEYAGPCPRCGGEDRFHVKGARFFCRQCFPRGGDVIDFIQWLHQVDFREACRRLAEEGGTITQAPVANATSSPRSLSSPEQNSPPIWQTKEFQRSVQRTLAATRRRLWSEDGGAGRDYLAARGIHERTARIYGLGFGATFHPRRQKNLPAIFLPWYHDDGKRIRALQHRFIDADIAKHERYTMKVGSQLFLFGMNALRPAKTVAVVEGEFNCMALHQRGIMALSVGSETNVRNPHTLAVLRRRLGGCSTVVVWLDRQELAAQLVTQLRSSPSFQEKTLHVVADQQDANDHLVAGTLEDFWREFVV